MDRNEEAIEVMSKRLASYMDENSSIASEKHSMAQKAQSVASPQVSLFIPGTAAK
jgi:hypothetical protein